MQNTTYKKINCINVIKIFGLLLFSPILHSQCVVQTINDDFEYPVVSGAGNYINQNTDPLLLGWKTTATDGLLEFWHNGNYQNKTAYSGNQFVELNATQSSGLYQDYDTSIATYFNYSFAHVGRLGVDSMVLKAGPPGGPYTIVTTATTDNTAWKLYSGTYRVPEGQTKTRFIFEALSTSTNDLSTGNFMDAVNFNATIDPPVFTDSSVSIIDGSIEKTICRNSSTTFKASGYAGAIFLWYDSAGTLLHQGPEFTTPLLISDTKYKVKQKNTSNCESSLMDIEVNISNLPVPTVNTTAATCSETSKSSITNYDLNNHYTFDPTGPSVDATGTITAMAAETPYTVTAKNADCISVPSAPFTHNDQLVTAEVPTITKTPATCSAASINKIDNYTDANVYTFNPTGPSVDATGSITAMAAETPYTVTAKNADCISVPSAPFTHNEQLVTAEVPTINNTPATCSEVSIHKISNYATTNLYTFNPTGPSVDSNGIVSAMVPGTPYTVTSKNANCVSVPSAAFTHNEQLDKPTIAVIKSPQAVCAGRTLTLTTPAITTNGSTITDLGWYLDDEAFVATTAVTYADNGKKLAYKIKSKCGEDISSNEVTIVVKNTLEVDDITEPEAVCAGNQLILTWPGLTINGATITAERFDLNGIPFDPRTVMTYADNGKELQYIVKTDCGDILSNKVTIVVNDKPLVDPITAPPAVCPGENLTLTTPAITTNGSTITAQGWYLDGNPFDPKTVVTYANNGGKLAYKVESNCDEDISSNEVTIVVKNTLEVDDIAAPEAVCAGNPLNLTAPSLLINGAEMTEDDWYLDGHKFDDQTVMTYADNGKELQYIAKTDCGDISSNKVEITVNDKPTIAPITAPAEVCSGSILNLSTPAITTNGSTITDLGWYLDDEAFVATTAVTYADNGKKLAYKIKSKCGEDISSNEVTIVVKNTLEVDDITEPEAVCAGNQLILTWPGLTINGATITAERFDLNGIPFDPRTVMTYADNGKELQYIVKTDCGDILSNKVTIVVNDKPLVDPITAPPAVCPGENLTLTTPAITTNGSTITAQGWYLDGNPFDPKTVVTYANNGGKLAYKVESNCDEDISSNEVTIVVKNTLEVDDIAAPEAVCAGNPLNLTAPSLLINGAEMTEDDWYLDGHKFDDQTVMTYADNGKELQYIAKTDCGDISSNKVEITVNDKPTIAPITAPAEVCSGSILNLSTPAITTNGSTITDLGWYLDDEAFVATTAVTYADNGKKLAYKIKSKCGEDISSNEVTIVVKNTLEVDDITEPEAVCAGNQLILTWPGLTINGATITAERWYLNGIPFDPRIIMTYADNGKELQYIVKTDCGDILSNKVTIVVNDKPLVDPITAPPEVCPGENLTLTTPAITTNGSTITAQGWYLDGNPFDPKTVVTYANNGGKLAYKVESNCDEDISSNEVTIVVKNTLEVGDITAPETVCAGNILNLTAPQLRINGAEMTEDDWYLDGHKFDDQTVMTYADNGKELQYIAKTDCGDISSNKVEITVNDKPTIAPITAPAEVCSGSILNLSTPAITTNGSTITDLGWYLDDEAFVATTAVTYADNGKKLAYKIKSKCGEDISSNEVTIVVKNTLEVDDITEPEAVCAGNQLILTWPGLTINGATITAERWYLNGIPFDPRTIMTYADNGKELQYIVKTDCGDILSNKVTIVVNDKPLVDPITAPPEVCPGENLTLTTPAITTNGSTITAQGWYLDGNPFDPKTVVTYANNGGKLAYKVESNCDEDISSNEVTIVVKNTLEVGDITAPETVCAGNTLNLTAPQLRINGAEMTEDDWYLDGHKFDDQTVMTYADNGKELQYIVKTDCGDISSNKVEITVNDKPEAIEISENICFGETFTWEVTGITYNQTGTYTKTNDGCTADQVLNLTIGTKPEAIEISENICFGETFTWEVTGITYNQTGTYTKTNDGCTADQVLNLTIGTKPEAIEISENICFGETFTWEVTGTTYNQTGTYTKTNDGCTADQVLKLTIGTKPEAIEISENICFGETFTWEVTGTTYNQTGTYTKNNDGCTADQVLKLTIGTKPEAIEISENICFGETFTWEVTGTTYNQTGTYIKNNDGCTADQVLKLTIGRKPEAIEISENICFGESFTWEVTGTTYNQTGTYTKNNDGCTADQVLKLTIGTKPEAIEISENICFGETFTWEVTGTTYNQTGTYIKNNDGCTADQVLNLTIGTKPEAIEISENICFGETFTWEVTGTTYNQTGTYTKTNDGCTADQVLKLTIGTKPEAIEISENICFGETFTWEVTGTTYNQTGTYTKNNDGCTADQVLKLTIGTKPEAIEISENICFGETFTWEVTGTTYNQTGTYTKTNDGCTADQVLKLTIGTKPEAIEISENICFGETFTWEVTGTTYNQTGTYTKTNDGCTADQVLKLTIGTKPEAIEISENICFGETFTWEVTGTTYNQTGTYTKTNDGCTADQVLNLTIGTKPEAIEISENICFGETFTWEVTGITYNQTGTYTKTNDGCTADQVLNLTIGTKPEAIEISENICFGETFTWEVTGTTYNQTGTYTKTNDGCTADQVLKLTIGTKPEAIEISENICFGETFTWEVTGTTYNQTGTYTKTNDGCTADQVLKLTIGTKPEAIEISENICFGETFTWEVTGTTYNQTGTYTKTNDGCTADQVLNLTIGTKPEAIEISENICFGETFTWEVTGTTYNQKGTYTKTNDGCTADQVLNLTIGTKPEAIEISENICFGETFTWEVTGITYNQTGTYTKTNDGCTADQVLNLTIGTKPEAIEISENICFGETFTWEVTGTTYNQTGTYTKTNDGCTADQVLKLTIGTKPEAIEISENICFGETFTWEVTGTTYNQTGTYTKTNDGCTADQVLKLTIGTKPEAIEISENICFGETFTWEVTGTTYNQTGTYTKTNDGCTADQVLNLTIGTKPEAIEISENICFGETFTWEVTGTTYNQKGTYTKTNDGCTADQVLKLTIGTKPEAIEISENICFGETFTWEVTGTTYNQTGTYIKNNDGCTADQVLKLTIGTKPEAIEISENICFGETFTWEVTGTTYNQTGTYTKTNDGCTADQVLKLTIGTKPEAIEISENICFGETFTWEVTGTTYNQTGTYTKTNDGCTADQVLKLTIGTKPEAIEISENICFGETFTWEVTGIMYNQTGTYTKNNDGCTADQVLKLTIGTKPEAIEISENICFGETFTWEVTGTTYNQTGTYTKNNDGCTADQVLKLTIGTKPEAIEISENICFGETFTWEVTGTTYNQTGTYTKTNDGCTADQVLKLTIGTKPEAIEISENICFGETFTWEVTGTTYNQTGTYTKTNDGCTADQVLKLTIGTKPEAIEISENICFGETFTWEVTGTTYNQTGTYIKNNDGCTADQVLKLTIGTKPEAIEISENICFGETFTWEVTGTTYNQTGTYTKTNDGCTADQVLNLTIGTKPEAIEISENICFGETFTWEVTGTTYNQTGTYTKTNDGCTADQVLKLNVLSAINISTVPNSIIPEFCIEDNNGSFKIKISGGSPPYSVSLNNSSYEQISGTEHIFTELAAGSYIAYVKDALECNTKLEVDIPNPISINPVALVNYSCINNSAENSVTITVDSEIINPTDIDYSLDGVIFQPSNVFTNIAPGTHRITARHANGCEQTTLPFIIDDVQPLALTLANKELNEIVATATGGVGGYQYTFEGEDYNSVNKFIIYKSGTYTITVTDKNGCTVSVSKYFEYIDVCISNYFTPNGDGINDEWGPDCTINYRNLTYTIFDRYGRVIGNYKYGQKWDGKYNGTELPSGDYWYVFKLNDTRDNREFVGYFTLYR